MSGRPHTECCPRKHGEGGKSTSRRGLVGLRSPGIDPNRAPGSVEAGVQPCRAAASPTCTHTSGGMRVGTPGHSPPGTAVPSLS